MTTGISACRGSTRTVACELLVGTGDTRFGPAVVEGDVRPLRLGIGTVSGETRFGTVRGDVRLGFVIVRGDVLFGLETVGGDSRLGTVRGDDRFVFVTVAGATCVGAFRGDVRFGRVAGDARLETLRGDVRFATDLFLGEARRMAFFLTGVGDTSSVAL